jgi:hypothetical protein
VEGSGKQSLLCHAKELGGSLAMGSCRKLEEKWLEVTCRRINLEEPG